LTSTSKTKPDFKFIHLADTHLGLNWPAIGRRENIQIQAYGKAFEAIVNAAIEQHVDFVIHAGDLVNRAHPPTSAWNRILQELPRLKQAGIPFIVTVGSHDRPESYFDRAGGDVLQILVSRRESTRIKAHEPTSRRKEGRQSQSTVSETMGGSKRSTCKDCANR